MNASGAELARWTRMLRADEANIAYFANRAELSGATLFSCDRVDAPEFDVALVYDVPEADVEATLRAIEHHYRERGRRARIRLSPVSTPGDWKHRLREAGYRDAGEPLDYFVVPGSLQLPVDPDVRIERVVSGDDCDRFAALQVAGFSLPPEMLTWERSLARCHFNGGRHAFYLASIGDRLVGAARCAQEGDITALAALATLPEARGRGVGTSLLARMIDEARARRSNLIVGAVVPATNPAALYARRGFVTQFTTQTFVRVD
jgi:GNAT superfamily N-acetyltransferase